MGQKESEKVGHPPPTESSDSGKSAPESSEGAATPIGEVSNSKIEASTLSKRRGDSFVRHILWDHPGVIVPLFFAVATTIGIYYAFTFYKMFNVNIAHFSQPEDFFFAWLQNRAVVYAVAGTFFMIIAFFLGNSPGRKMPINGYRQYFLRVLVLIFLLVLGYHIISKFKWKLSFLTTADLTQIFVILIANFALSFIVGILVRLAIDFSELGTSSGVQDRFNLFIKLSISFAMNLLVPIVITGLLLLGFGRQLRFMAKWERDRIKNGKIEDYSVIVWANQQGIQDTLSLRLIGSTSIYKIFYDADKKQIVTIPPQNILYMSISVP